MEDIERGDCEKQAQRLEIRRNAPIQGCFHSIHRNECHLSQKLASFTYGRRWNRRVLSSSRCLLWGQRLHDVKTASDRMPMLSTWTDIVILEIPNDIDILVGTICMQPVKA